MTEVSYYPLKRVVDSYDGELQKAVCRVVESGWFIRGEECRKFETDFAEYCGAKYCVGVGNGLEALSLILKGYIELGRLEPGDGVIVPSNTFIATWLAVKAAGLVPMPAEPDEKSYVLSLESVQKAFVHAQYSNVRVKAILAVHLYGRLCPMDRLQAFAEERGLLLLEDAAQAHGASMRWSASGEVRRAGNLGDAAGFSFYPGKNLGALGDAGAVVTNDEALASMVRKIANYGSEKKYVHECVGENSRLDEIQAAVLSVKLPHLDVENRRRHEIACRYISEIQNPLVTQPLCVDFTLPRKSLFKEKDLFDENNFVIHHYLDLAPKVPCVWHIFPIHCARPDGTSCRDEMQQHLKNLGIETLVHYPTPPHLQKAFVDAYGAVGYPIAEKLAREELSLPLHPFMTYEEIQAVIDAVNSFEAR